MQASRVFSHSISPPCTAICDYQPCHDPEFESKHVTATALPWQSRRSWQRKVHFPGFLALPEIFQALGHLIRGPRIPFLGGCSQFGHQQSLPFCTRQVWYSFFVVSVALVKECGGLSQSSVCFNGLREILQTILIHVVKDASL